tara:strand:- start:13203 stop:13325 length:123 start_codon:yes stop_codon:yes gene_type:complete
MDFKKKAVNVCSVLAQAESKLRLRYKAVIGASYCRITIAF